MISSNRVTRSVKVMRAGSEGTRLPLTRSPPSGQI